MEEEKEEVVASENSDKKVKKQKETRNWSSTKILDCVAYFAIMFIAIALIFKLIFKTNYPEVATAFGAIGECLAYIVCLWLGFYWTMRKRNGKWHKRSIWWLLCWIIAAVVIVVVYIFAV
jgi:cell division protein FtsW (lipid II flippase)